MRQLLDLPGEESPWLAEHCMKMTGMVEEQLWQLQIVEDEPTTSETLSAMIASLSKALKMQTKQSGYVVAFFEATNFCRKVIPRVGHLPALSFSQQERSCSIQVRNQSRILSIITGDTTECECHGRIAQSMDERWISKTAAAATQLLSDFNGFTSHIVE
ncbi:hypothetical protein TNCV_2480931 [Trichonephila clavipes]|nr:hypothetical protein TNCV_2480931 [Trichonephila clavipes]